MFDTPETLKFEAIILVFAMVTYMAATVEPEDTPKS